MTAQDFEREWWGQCLNTWHEEEKQLVYASRMGLHARYDVAHPPTFDLEGADVIDVGGGPVSLLLKCINRGPLCTVVDPCPWPKWVRQRYAEAGIELVRGPAEKYDWDNDFDEAWCYNVLQHVEDPEFIMANMVLSSATQRIFEWIDIPAYEGHPNELTGARMRKYFPGGIVSNIAESGATGRAFYGEFSP
jgi:2-polyprenyl-3-methyl-5-hydroxy-6-metoxy-1,4-benzoquinol methylase